MIFLKTATLVLALFLTGCASVGMAPKEADAAAKKFSPPPNGKAGLYVFRNEYFGNTITKPVVINGMLIGETAGHSYFHLILSPGKYFVSSPGDQQAMLISNLFSGKSVSIDLELGKNHFIWQEIKTGGPAQLYIVDDATGRQGVLESDLASLQVDPVDIRPSGARARDTQDSDSNRLRELKNLLDQGLITESEYTRKRQEIVEKL